MKKIAYVFLALFPIIGGIVAINKGKNDFRWYDGSLFLESNDGQEYAKRLSEYAKKHPNADLTRDIKDSIIIEMGLKAK